MDAARVHVVVTEFICSVVVVDRRQRRRHRSASNSSSIQRRRHDTLDRKLRFSVAGKDFLFYDPVLRRPSNFFGARFCRKFCNFYASMW